MKKYIKLVNGTTIWFTGSNGERYEAYYLDDSWMAPGDRSWYADMRPHKRRSWWPTAILISLAANLAWFLLWWGVA